MTDSHYAYVDEEVPVGVGHVCQAYCVTCSWRGTLGASPNEARIEKLAHERDNHYWTIDDIAWANGTGRWSQG